MIRRTHRFHGYNSLNFVYQKGRTVRGGQMAIRTALNNRRSSYRVAVVVSKKVSKSAVQRNRIRRRIYEIVRQEQQYIELPLDIVITAYSEALVNLEHEKLAHELKELLKKSGALNQAPTAHATIEQKEN